MSTSLSYINLREEEGYGPARLMSKYKDDTGRPLAAILSLNTIANTIGAAGVGMLPSLLQDRRSPFPAVPSTARQRLVSL